MEDDFSTKSPEENIYGDNNNNGGGEIDDMPSAVNYQDTEYGLFGLTPEQEQELDYNPVDDNGMEIAPTVLRRSTTTKPKQMKTTPRKNSGGRFRATTTRKPQSSRYYYSFLMPRRNRYINWWSSINSGFGSSNWLMKG